jgi:hypothetical protein
VKKVHYILVFLIFTGVNLNGQNGRDSIQYHQQNWKIGLSASPVVTFYIKKKDRFLEEHYPFVKSSQLNYGMSIFAQYKLTKHKILEFGVNYDILQYSMGLMSGEKKYFYKYLSIPIMIDFPFGTKNFFVDFGFGVQDGIFIDKEVINNNWIFDNSWGALMGTIRLGFNYKWKNNFSVFFKLQIYQGISTITYRWRSYYSGEILEASYYFNYYKINFGIIYNFSK